MHACAGDHCASLIEVLLLSLSRQSPSPSVTLKKQLCCLQAGASLARKLSASKRTDRERETTAAKLGLRRGLDMASVSPDGAAELLLTADAVLEACPRMEAAKCARVEVSLPGCVWVCDLQGFAPAHLLHVGAHCLSPSCGCT